MIFNLWLSHYFLLDFLLFEYPCNQSPILNSFLYKELDSAFLINLDMDLHEALEKNTMKIMWNIRFLLAKFPLLKSRLLPILNVDCKKILAVWIDVKIKYFMCFSKEPFPVP